MKKFTEKKEYGSKKFSSNSRGGDKFSSKREDKTLLTKRNCRFCESKDIYIDFKDEKRLIRLLNEQGKITPKRITGTCAKHQRMLVRSIKRARYIALLPFVAEAVK
ncbi:MAG: 30S ribosomal protein S18 [Ignavibacteria bacterium]|nr:30S ribosomal protein S18 [Bacteroidota bacterium]MSQ45810.1 30S ribosomal protein S18 [Ignavibacteria bacterium]